MLHIYTYSTFYSITVSVWMAVQCSEQDDEYPPPTVVENLDPHDPPIGGIQNTKPKVYISHAEESSRYVQYLRRILENHLGYQQHEVLSLEGDSIGGLSTTQNIRTLVKRSEKMIVVISKDYTRSHWSPYEMATILQNGNIANADIIPIISDDGSTADELPDELSILIPLHAKDKHFIRRLRQSLEYSSNP